MGTCHGRLRTRDHGRADAADALFQEALSHHAPAGRPLDAARTQLSYGEWLRRNQRRVDARQHLRLGLETFQDLRAEALAARADQELRASGETARKRDPSTLVKLTPMELKIAQLVTSGMSNKDVAAQCWISPRTVAFHLRNVFAKAGVTSRGELAQSTWPSATSPPHPGHLAGVSNPDPGHARPQCHHPLRERDRHEHRHPPPRTIRAPRQNPGRTSGPVARVIAASLAAGAIAAAWSSPSSSSPARPRASSPDPCCLPSAWAGR